jgi:hypothetical protein
MVIFPIQKEMVISIAFSMGILQMVLRMDRSKGFSDDVVIFEASVTVLGQEDDPFFGEALFRDIEGIPSGKRLHNGKSSHFSWANQLFRLGPFSMSQTVKLREGFCFGLCMCRLIMGYLGQA